MYVEGIVHVLKQTVLNCIICIHGTSTVSVLSLSIESGWCQLLAVHLTLGEIANDLFAVCCRPDADDGQEHGGAEGVAEVAKEGTRQCDQHRHSTGPGAPPRADSA